MKTIVKSHLRKGRLVRKHLRVIKSMGFMANGKINDFPEKEVLNLKATDKPVNLKVYAGWNKSERRPFDIIVDKDSNVSVTPSNRPAKEKKDFVSRGSGTFFGLDKDIAYKMKVPESSVHFAMYDNKEKNSGEFHTINIKPKGKVEIVPENVSQKDSRFATSLGFARARGENINTQENEKKEWRKSVGYED